MKMVFSPHLDDRTTKSRVIRLTPKRGAVRCGIAVICTLAIGCSSGGSDSDAPSQEPSGDNSRRVGVESNLSVMDPDEVFTLACQYADGEGRPQDDARAASLLQAAASKGHSDSATMLGRWYLRGRGVDKDLPVALEWLEAAANGGSSEAEFILGATLLQSPDLPQDCEQALVWLTRAAQAGEANAQLILGDLYYRGECVIGNPEEAVYWTEKAARSGNGAAQNLLAEFYCRGHGVEADYVLCYAWARIALPGAEFPELAQQMTITQIEKAESTARELKQTLELQ